MLRKKNKIKKDDSHRYMGFVPYDEYMLWTCLNHVLSKNKKICVIFCNPLLDERLTCHPYYLYFADYLADFAISSVRFDYLGTGESMPPTSTYSIEKYSKQIHNVISLLRNTDLFDVIGLFGVSSSSLILQRLLDRSDINFCMSWEPVLKSKQYSKSLFRANILEQQTIYQKVKYNSEELGEKLKNGEGFMVEGHQITSDFIESINRDFTDYVLNCNIPLRVECFKMQTYKTLKKVCDKNAKQNVMVVNSSIDTMFWGSSCIKYLDLPFQSIEDCAKWIQTVSA